MKTNIISVVIAINVVFAKIIIGSSIDKKTKLPAAFCQWDPISTLTKERCAEMCCPYRGFVRADVQKLICYHNEKTAVPINNDPCECGHVTSKTISDGFSFPCSPRIKFPHIFDQKECRDVCGKHTVYISLTNSSVETSEIDDNMEKSGNGQTSKSSVNIEISWCESTSKVKSRKLDAFTAPTYQKCSNGTFREAYNCQCGFGVDKMTAVEKRKRRATNQNINDNPSGSSSYLPEYFEFLSFSDHDNQLGGQSFKQSTKQFPSSSRDGLTPPKVIEKSSKSKKLDQFHFGELALWCNITSYEINIYEEKRCPKKCLALKGYLVGENELVCYHRIEPAQITSYDDKLCKCGYKAQKRYPRECGPQFAFSSIRSVGYCKSKCKRYKVMVVLVKKKLEISWCGHYVNSKNILSGLDYTLKFDPTSSNYKCHCGVKSLQGVTFHSGNKTEEPADNAISDDDWQRYEVAQEEAKSHSGLIAINENNDAPRINKEDMCPGSITMMNYKVKARCDEECLKFSAFRKSDSQNLTCFNDKSPALGFVDSYCKCGYRLHGSERNYTECQPKLSYPSIIEESECISKCRKHVAYLTIRKNKDLEVVACLKSPIVEMKLEAILGEKFHKHDDADHSYRECFCGLPRIRIAKAATTSNASPNALHSADLSNIPNIRGFLYICQWKAFILQYNDEKECGRICSLIRGYVPPAENRLICFHRNETAVPISKKNQPCECGFKSNTYYPVPCKPAILIGGVVAGTCKEECFDYVVLLSTRYSGKAEIAYCSKRSALIGSHLYNSMNWIIITQRIPDTRKKKYYCFCGLKKMLGDSKGECEK